MLTDLTRLLENVDVLLRHLRVRMVGVVLIDQLREAQRARHPRRASADDDNIGLHLRTVDAFKGFAKSDHRRLDRIQGSAAIELSGTATNRSHPPSLCILHLYGEGDPRNRNPVEMSLDAP